MSDIPVKKTGYADSQASKQADAVAKSRLTNKSWVERRRLMRETRQSNSLSTENWRRESRVLPREEAREFARQFLQKYPKAAYWSEVESWRVLDGDVIEFTMRRLPSAD